MACLGTTLSLAVCLGACSSPPRAGEEATPSRAPAEAAAERANAPVVPSEPQLGPVTKGSQREHPGREAWVFDPAKKPRKISIGRAEAEGYTVIDLGNDWVPYIFSEKTPGQDDAKKNLYRKTYIDLANDRVDSEGTKLAAHQHNYLELYGIPPTLAVVFAEWQEVEQGVETCLSEAGYDPKVFERIRGTIAFTTTRQDRELKQSRWLKAALIKKMKQARLKPDLPESWETAATHPKTRTLHRKWRDVQDRVDIVDHAQRRFRCERLFERNQGRGTFEPGAFDFETSIALAAFEKKHDIKGWGHFTRDNVAVLAMSPVEVAHARLLRVIEERTVSAAGIVEDGSAARWKPKFTFKDANGQEHTLRDVAGEATKAVIDALELGTPESARKQLAALSDLPPTGFDNLLIAVRLPELPAYYAPEMKFSAVIDRGDVWYDFPYGPEGQKLAQPRRAFPTLTVYVDYLDQRIPLIRWRTTIGSWRSELHDGQVYLRYKNSDVGSRVWKDIVAAPVWIPPDSTPSDELLKRKYVNNKLRTVLNYDEIGPGYKSAYGLVAAYHIRQVFNDDGSVRAELDNQIRTHGSVDYMSILRRYSHGCHRLYNMSAVRLFSFILQHREYNRLGQERVGFRRVLTHEEQEYRLAIDTRGYKYELVEPIVVDVTKGRIKGKRKTPIEEHLPKPGVEYDTADTDGADTDGLESGAESSPWMTPATPVTPAPVTPAPTTTTPGMTPVTPPAVPPTMRQ